MSAENVRRAFAGRQAAEADMKAAELSQDEDRRAREATEAEAIRKAQEGLTPASRDGWFS